MCCNGEAKTEHCCSDMEMMINEERSVVYVPKFREYGFPILDGGSSFLIMKYCPWCGRKLPTSLRSEYFGILKESGLEYPCRESELPEEMRSDKWWRERGIGNDEKRLPNDTVGGLTFVEALKQGLADYEDIDDYINAWHEGDSTLPLHEFLGMTWREYCVWAEDGAAGLKRLFKKGEKKAGSDNE